MKRAPSLLASLPSEALQSTTHDYATRAEFLRTVMPILRCPQISGGGGADRQRTYLSLDMPHPLKAVYVGNQQSLDPTSGSFKESSYSPSLGIIATAAGGHPSCNAPKEGDFPSLPVQMQTNSVHDDPDTRARHDSLIFVYEDPQVMYSSTSESEFYSSETEFSDDDEESSAAHFNPPQVYRSVVDRHTTNRQPHEIGPVSAIPNDILDRSIIPTPGFDIKKWKCSFEKCSDPTLWRHQNDARAHVRRHLAPYWCRTCHQTFACKKTAQKHQKPRKVKRAPQKSDDNNNSVPRALTQSTCTPRNASLRFSSHATNRGGTFVPPGRLRQNDGG